MTTRTTTTPAVHAETFPTRAAWLLARRKSLGGSDSPKIMGLSSYGTPMSVYAEKRGLLEDDAVASEAAEWGRLLEPLVADRYQRETGHALEDPGPFTLVRNPQYPSLHVTPDRYVRHPTRGRGLLSIKTTSAFKRGDWTEEAPPAYLVQCQHEMLVTGLPWTAVAVLIGGQTFKYIDIIERDDTFCRRLADTLAQFWDAVQRGEPPSVDASEACKAVLRALYPKDSGDTIALPAELVEFDALWLEAKQNADFWMTRKDLAENTLRAALKEATKGILPNGVAWTNRLQHRKAFEMPATEFRKLIRSKKG